MPSPVDAGAATEPVFGNYGSGSLNAHTGSGSQNNNNANGAQYNANAIYQIENYYSTSPSGDPPSDIKKLLAEERKLCLRSLSFLNIDARQQDIARAHPTTCDWFFQTDDFRQWHDRTDSETYNGVLWVKGNPGAGKSTLMKHILGYCQRVFEGHTITSYFFNARGDAFEKTPLGMLRSLVFQLIDKEPSAYDRFVLIFRKKYEIHQEEWKWREPELKEFLLSEIQHLAKPLVLLVDALDECSESHVRDVVGFLEELSVNASNAMTILNICLSSRHYPHISMKRYREMVIDKREEHNRDIATYVRDKLTKCNDDIEREVLFKASGVFMWVVLVVTMLNTAYDRGRVEAMHQTLREVPHDLDTLFGTLLSQENPDWRETILMLQWVLFARRLLKPEELYYAMLAGTVPETLGAWDPSEITRDDIRRRITDSSKGLIEVRKGDTEITRDDIRRRTTEYSRGLTGVQRNIEIIRDEILRHITDFSRDLTEVREGDTETVQFIHESVNDFLLRNRRLQKLDAALESNPVGASHDRLKDCCMSYIKMLPLPKDRAEAKSFGSNHPLLEYASMYVFDHVEAAEAGHVGQAEFLQSLQEADGDWERVRLFHNSFEENPGSRCARGVDLLYMAAVHGYNSLVQVLLKKGAAVNAQVGLLGTPLQAAAHEGNKEIVAMLLEKSANVNAQGGHYGTALQAAACQGNKEMVEILLQKGAEVNSQGGFYGTALYGAAYWGHGEIVAMLLEKGADVNVQSRSNRTALYAAADRGHGEILTMFFEKGVDFNEQRDSYRHALHSAALGGNKEIIKILLENCADIDLQGDFYTWALQAAASYGHKEIAIMLLEKDANVDAHDYPDGTALHAAASSGHEEIVTILLEKGANVNAQGYSKETALQAAASHGYQEIVAILLEKGADINTLGWEETVSNLSEEEIVASPGSEETVASPVDKNTFNTTLQVAAVIFMIFLCFNW